jgi:CMP-N,N'-diacetyllegionaminic acid synthase
MNLLFTICGRAGSKGIPKKNIRSFLGYPLPFYTASVIDLYCSSHLEHHADLVLNTDSTDLIELFENHLDMLFSVINRDPAIALDSTPKIAVIANCLEVMTKRTGLIYDMVIDLDITAPLRTLQDLENLIRKKAESAADVVFSVVDARRNPYFNMVKRIDDGVERVIGSNFNSRQEAPDIYDMNASLYAYTPSYLTSGKGIFDGKCDITLMFDTAVLDLDHPQDFELMEVIAAYLFERKHDFKSIRDHIPDITKAL